MPGWPTPGPLPVMVNGTVIAWLNGLVSAMTTRPGVVVAGVAPCTALPAGVMLAVESASAMMTWPAVGVTVA